MPEKETTIECCIKVTVPKGANDAEQQRIARSLLIELAAEIVRCTVMWKVDGSEE